MPYVLTDSEKRELFDLMLFMKMNWKDQFLYHSGRQLPDGTLDEIGLAEPTFQEFIERRALQTSLDSLYPRPDFNDLAEFLKGSKVFTPALDDQYLNSTSPSTSDVKNSFVVIHNLSTGSHISYQGSATDMIRFRDVAPAKQPTLVFLRGHASQFWLNGIASTYGPSVATLYQRHLDFKAFKTIRRDLYSPPGLPSSLSQAFQLLIPTLCFNNEDISAKPEDLRKARRMVADRMKEYFKKLGQSTDLAGSVVRNCLLLSKQAYVLEQRATIEVIHGQGWRVIVWLDTGKDLSQSLGGPWLPSPGTKPWETYFVPVIVDRHFEAPAPSADDSYGQQLDKTVASEDALYALSELFSFAAAAEIQFLNLLEFLIEYELSFVGEGTDSSMFYEISLLNQIHQNADRRTYGLSVQDGNFS
ncbi:hypothetical protein S40285_10002 [Stachybotrys chlorohalonatus IBT 40285]|uniref:Uncharacterized protein n=1 Tax=Stachybotrys chlorohalonatus (strain IBT 40285) TaxID=1283841 RepID=A0A084QWT0_STAC4|nr:hypothetical protein S40285_10002 [Stachybotrys chlorohalonata IBT 40285]